MRCLGPAESEWNEQVFTVSSSGCIGGRKLPEDLVQRRDFIIFKEATISRSHFQISLDNGAYCVRDLGSAGGCFIRIFKRKELYPGMIIVCGKHQFLVSSIDDAAIGGARDVGDEEISSAPGASGGTNARSTRDSTSLDLMGPEMEGMMNEATELQALIAVGQRQDPHGCGRGANADEIARRLMQIQARVLRMSVSGSEQGVGTASGVGGGRSRDAKDCDDDDDECDYDDYDHGHGRDHGDDGLGGGPGSGVSAGEGVFIEGNRDNSPSHPSHTAGRESRPQSRYKDRRLKLTCFNPEASPMVGKTFVVGPKGATIGRAQSNDIALCAKITRADGEAQKWTSIDSAVSSVHAHIILDSTSGAFYVCDGSPSHGDGGGVKPSLNGTWFRLSGPNQESPFFKLVVGMELLIGTIRFQVGETLTITETNVVRNASAAGAARAGADADADAKAVVRQEQRGNGKEGKQQAK
jgi:pSer/pThr/pTyr-binding forkhead associated (FHA) protein